MRLRELDIEFYVYITAEHGVLCVYKYIYIYTHTRTYLPVVY